MFSVKRLFMSIVGGGLALVLTAAAAGAGTVSPTAVETAKAGAAQAAENARGHLADKTTGVDRAIEVVQAALDGRVDKPGNGPEHALEVLRLVKARKAGGDVSPSSLAPGKGLEKVAEAYKQMRGNAYGHDKAPGKPEGTPGKGPDSGQDGN